MGVHSAGGGRILQKEGVQSAEAKSTKSTKACIDLKFTL